VNVWAGTIEDRPGGLAAKLETLAAAGVNLEFIIARRQPGHPGTGVVFVAPIAGAAQSRAAKKAGLTKAGNMFSLRLEGPDKPGIGATASRALANADINMRGFSGAALGRKAAIYFAFDNQADARKASQALKKEFK
jgi:hypothetical protein